MRQREARRQREAAQATISAHVYHEIRNVVGAVLALAERASEAVDLALEEKSGQNIKNLPEEVRKLTEHQRLVCQHAVNTLNDMLDVARMENGTYRPSMEVIDLGALCRQAAALQSPRLKQGVDMILDVPKDGELVVLSDPALLLQYLTNLLSNAAKFTELGHVMVTCDHRIVANSGWVEVILGVCDTGPGIRQQDQERVLQAFTTGTAVPREDIGPAARSTGIGLRLANLIAQILGDVKHPCIDPAENREENCMHISHPIPESLKERLQDGGGPGTFLTIKACMQLASESLIEAAKKKSNESQQTDFNFTQFTLAPTGFFAYLLSTTSAQCAKWLLCYFRNSAPPSQT